jgi:transcriptional regulator with XRE-family HTH domain
MTHLGCVLIQDKKFVRAFGEKIRSLRLELNMSQEDLANTADIPINQVGRIERGEINTTLVTAKAIAEALNLTLPVILEDI